ncbi:three-Cys-motif partner protein TcmP [Haloechinothrix aidingensis]|nr:three-Cys-motif partner protein TcmP [Haloechinothrix aidingensis]
MKHGLLRRYCPAFASKAGQLTMGRVTFLDGYAGAGCYNNDEPGSPLVLMEAAHAVSANRAVEAIFVEKDRGTFERLEIVLNEKCSGQSYTALYGDIDDHIDHILDNCRGTALFAFFDPFGPTLSADRVRSLLNKRTRDGDPTDVLVHVSVRSVWNFGSRLTKARHENRDLDPSDQKFIVRLDRFLGVDWWKDKFATVGESYTDEPDGKESGVKPANVALDVAQEYADRIARETGYYTISMPVRRRPGHVPIFVLTLFTRHGDGAWLFADSIGHAGLDWEESWQHSEISREGPRGQTGLFSQPESWSFDRDEYERRHSNEWIEIIASNIDALLMERESIRIYENVVSVFGNTLGTGARETHVRKAVKHLYMHNRVDHDGKGRYFYRDSIRRPAT